LKEQSKAKKTSNFSNAFQEKPAKSLDELLAEVNKLVGFEQISKQI
jgi:hypothetical protein